VRAAAERGRANAALIRLLASRLDCPPSAIRVLSGGTARWKRLHIAARADRLAALAQL
jgi:uncharacterized protein YggU (UPF0235/DUF167 family)